MKRRTKKTTSEKYAPGKITKLWGFLVKLHAENPQAFVDEKLLKHVVSGPWKSLTDPEHCPNCGESMSIYEVRLDYHKAELLVQMGRTVRDNLKKGVPFTEANKVHVVSHGDMTDAVRHATSQARTLGLIAKVQTPEGKHDTKAGWLITRRGFDALGGKPVRASVPVFRNKIIEIEGWENGEKTLSDVINEGNPGRSREIGYDVSEWVHVAEVHQGQLL